MLRPEQMSKVSVTGSKAVMDPVIETVHDLNRVHLSDYDGSWEGFDNGTPRSDADDASEKLVTVRSLESILDVDRDEAGPSRIVTDEALDEELEEIRTEANDLDDRRNEVESELREVEEEIDEVEPFTALGVPLDLLSGYDSLEVAVGQGDPAAVRRVLADSKAIRSFDIETGDQLVAVFAYPESNARESILDDLLVQASFTRTEVPDAEGNAAEYIEQLRHRKQQLESKLSTIEDEIGDLRLDAAGFLLAAEERLTIDVQKSEAPLQFATTESAFVAEGWIPTEEVDHLKAELADVVGDRVDVDEIERAKYRDGQATSTEHVAPEGESSGKTAATDGGVVTMNDSPPTMQENVGPAEPFELLTKMVGLPSYDELDPTFFIMLTFPAFFGFMIGDLGYGILYAAAGFFMYSRFDSDAIRALGGIGIWAGAFTMLFGVLYGEIFGLHVLGEVLFNGKPPMHKGLQPTYSRYAQTWLFVSVLAGLAHMTLGYFSGVVNNLSHGIEEVLYEDLSWLTMMLGLWLAILSTAAEGIKPSFLFNTLGGEGAAYNLGYTGLPESAAFLGLGMFALGLVVMTYGEFQHMGVPGLVVGPLESVNVLVNVLSYFRLAAVLLAKAGMAFVVNLLFFGAWEDSHGAWHFGTGGMPSQTGIEYHHYEVADIMFGGLLHGGIAMALIGVVILVVGHFAVLLLGITSAGLQGIRLEYVEFFDKFYDGDGRTFDPFGYEREFTTED
ncbi:V-type ATP synthase subunit I [Haloarchaeobius iranensis]|uniref:A-type ATP synthase subunit I n=1 Tax=Haloarchaeobius iranensis TaxID=996166 RepID=A0A1G9VFL5_9EURY|nr:V-type ATP synthase subunit I [Haloarchaeobius iranensis]SDM70847.1 V/A-type H+-transporting ATPase subunit I [Haloarchaeobius iranensis]